MDASADQQTQGGLLMKTWIRYAAAAAVLTAALSANVQADSAGMKAEEYLSEYFNIKPFTAEDADPDTVNAALTALGGESLDTEASDHEAIIAEGIRLAGLEELALSYENDANPGKRDDVLKREGVTAEKEEYAPYIAAALDLGLIENGTDGKTDPEEFLYRCIEIGGKGRRYIGRVNDPNILSELSTALNGFMLFDEKDLTELGNEIVLSGATTGYSLKYNKFDAHFLADYTLRYSHSDYRHAIQLIGLLRSEGMDAYIQIEPKVSVYEYMADWGDPGEPTPTYAVREAEDGRYLCYAIEYDMELEFDTRKDKEAFHKVIEDYAKKYDDRVDEDGNVTAKLLAESWWQPLYSSLTRMENDEFGELVDNVVYDKSGEYSIHPFSLPDKSGEIMAKAKEIAPDLEVNPVTVYANPAFVRYLTGEDHQ